MRKAQDINPETWEAKEEASEQEWLTLQAGESKTENPLASAATRKPLKPSMNNTIFDRIISGEIPSDKVFENENAIAINDINPQAPTHILVIPKKRIERFTELKDWNEKDVGAFFLSVVKVASELGLDTKDCRIVINNGSNAGQTVEYLHAHILAGRRMSWPPG